MNKIAIIGAGGHARVVLESLLLSGWSVAGFIDQTENKEIYKDFPLLGGDEALAKIREMGIEYVAMGIGQTGSSDKRRELMEAAEQEGFKFPVIQHPASIVSRDALVGAGTVVFPRAVVNPGAVIGKLCTVNTGAIVEHDVIMDNYVHLAPGGTLLGGCKVGENTFIGANATILPQVSVGKNVVIGAGSVVLKDVADGCRLVGNPARIIE